jgi:hypothetical protein
VKGLYFVNTPARISSQIISVTQNLSDGLRAVVMSSVGRKFPIQGVAQFTYPSSSWRNVLRLTHINSVDVGSRATGIIGCCASFLLHTSQRSSEQFCE